nr:MAG TPA: CotH kinase protein [Caudoviricetes sp.]
MATIDEIKQQAAAVKNATQVGENTAERVGGALAGLADIAKHMDTELGKKANTADVNTKFAEEKKRVDAELGKKFDKESVAQEFGDSEDKVVSQFALPFREIESPEFLKAIVDAEDHFLFGIKLDGSIEWGNGIPAPIRAKLQEIVSQIQLQITNLQENKVDKEEGKSLIENEVKECFKVIENKEFLWAVVDSEDRVLFGIYRATGKPYYPLNEMYHVIQNEEYFAAWVTADDKILLGIRRDGQIIGEIHAVNALKQVVSKIQEKLDTIDSNLKELLDVLSLQENPEYLAVEKDADGKVLSATYNDGSHYIHNAKSETIPEEFEHIEDPEGRTEITTDADKKVMSYRDSSGKKHEYAMEVTNLEVSNLNLKGNSVNDICDALKANDFKLDSPSDFSKDSYVELPIPRVAAQVRIYASKLPTTKQDDIEAEIEYNDKDGNYFRKPVILNSQGSSSISYIDKETGERGNIAIDINDGSKIKFGDFPTQDSFHLKKYYIDIFRGQCIVGYWLMEQVYQTRPIGKRYPYEMLSEESNPYTGDGKADKDFYTGAKCHPDGFPVIITWIDTKTKKEKNIGIYAWNLKKSKEIYHVNKKTPENIILDGVINDRTLFGGSVDWTQFEIRNPKSLIDIDGNKYDGDNPNELSETDKNSKKVKDYIIRLSGAKAALAGSNNKETFEKYFIVDAFIDYFIVSQVLYHLDGFSKNWIWGTWNGLQWAPTLYDVDSIWGAHWAGTFIVKGSDIQGVLGTGRVLNLDTLYADEIIARYKELRDLNVFSVDNIVNLLKTWLDRIGYDNLEKEISLYSDIPSYRDPQLNEGWDIVNYSSQQSDYSSDKTYNIGDTCVYKNYKFKAIKEIINVPPLKMFYEHAPRYCGFYNSIKRVSVWLTNRISFLDKTYKYNI